jgi:glycerophosphoryl diester phosphodiesterase
VSSSDGVLAPPGAPFVFAHRGGSTEVLAEHTLESYRYAIDAGADGLECDVRLTRDGHLVCIHDGRLDRTSNGHGRVSAATLTELEQLDFGCRVPAQRTALFGVLTLDRLLGLAVEAGRPLRLLIETKHPSRFGSTVESNVVELLHRYGLAEPASLRAAQPAQPAAPSPVQVAVMSFSPLAVRSMRQLAPAVPTAFLFELALPRVLAGRAPFGAEVLGPSLTALREHPELVGRAHDRGRAVYVWTVNEAADIDFVVGLGVDGIISDRPAEVLSRLGR